MANIYGRQYGLTKEALTVTLYARVTFGGTGAPTLVTAQSKGIKSVTRNSTGKYTFVFGNSSGIDQYTKLLFVGCLFDAISNTGTAPLAPLMYLQANSVAAAAGSLQIVFNSTAQAAADPASGEAVYMVFELSNSTAY